MDTGHVRGGRVPWQYLCSAHADGLSFHLEEFGAQVPIGVAALFRHHVRLLGPDPAKWTGNPVS